VKKTSSSVLGLGLATTLVLLGGACCAKPKPVPAPEVKAAPVPVATPVPVPAEVPTPPPPPPPPCTDPSCLGLDELNKGYLKDTFFDFDKYDVRADQRDALAANAAWMKKYPSVKVRVEGHCDERGTDKYNMALGDKRANAVKDYLVSLGIDSGRVETISFGKSKPFADGHNEEAWAQNRRGHFVVIAK